MYLQQGKEESVCVGTKNIQYILCSIQVNRKVMCLDQFWCEFAYLDRQRQNHNVECDKKNENESIKTLNDTLQKLTETVTVRLIGQYF